MADEIELSTFNGRVRNLKAELFARQSIDITNLLQCALEFQSDHAQWRSRGTSGGTRPGAQALQEHQHTIQTF